MKSSILLLGLMLGLVGCGNHIAQNVPTNPGYPTVDDASAEKTSDALIAPAQPELYVEAEPETLVFSWQGVEQHQLANIYEFDSSTSKETLIVADIDASTNTLSIPSNSPLRIWHAQQFRLELCDSIDCISSKRVSIDALTADTSQKIRPSVFVQGERFADSFSTNHDASVLVTSLPVAGAIQIHFRIQKKWIGTEPLKLTHSATSFISDISTSQSGDTIAVLVSANGTSSEDGQAIILDRLGESWIETNSITLQRSAINQTPSKMTLSANGDYLMIHTSDEVHTYQRDDLGWSLQSPLVASSGSLFADIAISPDFKQLYALVLQDQQLWLLTHRVDETRPVSAWQQTSRTLIQGIDIHDDVSIQTSADGRYAMVAGWITGTNNERTPIAWRFVKDSNETSDESISYQVMDSIRLAPTQQHTASLRFAANSQMDSVAVGWQTTIGDDAQLTMLIYDDNERQWRTAFELPQAIPTLAKQGFAQNVVLSGDGRTLLMSNPAGNASSVENRVGELLIVR